MEWIKNARDTLSKNLFLGLCLLPIGILVFTSSIQNIISRMTCELQLSFTWDSPVYWAVGRGILNGLKPYVDMFETKPPGIFLLSAFSFATTGDVFLGNIFCFLCLLIIGFSPVFATYYALKDKNSRLSQTIACYFTAAIFGLLLMLYCQVRSGQIQVEGLGAAFCCLYFITISNMKVEKLKLGSPSVLLAALFVMTSIMFKEPFLFAAIAGALIFIHTAKDLFYKLVLPLLYGGLVGVLLLSVSGLLLPYIQIYLPSIFGKYVTGYGSPFDRGFEFKKVLNDIGGFSSGLQMAIILLCGLFVFLLIMDLNNKLKDDQTSRISILLNFFKIPFIFCLPVFAIGLGGQFYNHHFIFALPVYIALFIFFIRRIAVHQSNHYLYGILIALFVLSSAGMVLLPPYTYDTQVLAINPVLREEATYVDSILDASHVGRYQYLGYNGNVFYGFTKHSPLGPVFFQDPNYFKNSNWFTNNLINQLNKADIIIIDRVDVPIINEQVNSIMQNDFTETPWKEVASIKKPAGFHYKILYRKR